jgi:hypothetical protein
MGLLAAPLNSSHQFVVHVMEPVAGVVPHCAAADFGIAERRIPNTKRTTKFITLRPVTGITSAEMKSTTRDWDLGSLLDSQESYS